MGILSRIFGKKSIESLKEFEEELNKFREKNDSEMLALIGTGGRLKGLALVHSSKDEDLMKKYAARVNELMDPLNLVTQGKKVEELSLKFDGNHLIFKPITEDISFFAITQEESDISSIVEWIEDKRSDLENLL